MRFQAVIFDMDGTLLETEAMVIASGLDAMAALDLAPRRDLLESLVGTITRDAAPVFEAVYGAGFSMQALEAEWDRSLAARIARGIPLRPGASALLAHLDRIGMKRALATNSRTVAAHDHLARAGIRGFFADEHIHGRDRVEHPKPAPDLFLHAAETLGVDPDDCVVFEDSDPGATGAVAAGMTCVLVPDQRPPAFSGPHVRAASLLEGARAVGIMPG
ncbi:MAG: HAD family phosphatase [Rubellimicrobium sp.]|nr:HAD family phosphatase [Rubellimicrobium sp.]